jgi:DNA ligase 1
MKRFALLFQQIDQTNKTHAKVEALAAYFTEAEEADKLWAVALLSDRRPGRTINTRQLRAWAAERADLPLWLFEESYHIVGDLAETIALLLPPAGSSSDFPLHYWVHYLQQLASLEEDAKKAAVLHAWDRLDPAGRFIFNKLLTGNWRVGVSGKLVAKALAKATGLEENVILHRLSGQWDPQQQRFSALLYEEEASDLLARPYPFCLAYALQDAATDLEAPPDQWLAEYKWDGIRGQIIRRGDDLYVWTRGEELVTDKYPEYQSFLSILPNGCVLDGEILAWKDGQPLPFGALQTRIGRKTVGRKQREETPVIFMAYDLLEHEGADLRQQPFEKRRALLAELVAAADSPTLLLSAVHAVGDWSALAALRAQAAAERAEGVMLKHRQSPYHTGRKKGDWWKWKIDPLTVDAVLIYAQQGHGRRANLLTDYTFAVWHEGSLTPFTKAYSGLTDQEFREVDAWIRRHTLEKFGPVRSVQPELVFEIAFEGIQRSKRHKSGVALRFPRMLRWRRDKPAAEADSLADLEKLLPD